MDFSGFTAAELATLRTNALAALNNLLTGGIASYSIHGRSFTMVNVSDLRKLISDVSIAQKIASGAGQKFVNVDMSQ